ncbi:gamma-glutamyltransferase family protein [Roseisolibacter agri]|uniref:Gamma-glutamyltransferase n=1 Tax=Roseisolibacter agri TaxID=2014610 RepID=A0AA37VEU1_9BACT|nr:gamma-glutamyltransferase [Roseisolibacter agri]GLC25784.1 gamma-glutamyltransferase [Roseisolibacter agri]
MSSTVRTPRLPLLAPVALTLAACAAPRASSVTSAEPPLAGKRVEARRGVVVTSAADASNAGLAMLAQGGNAIDAAVAASFALGVVDPSQTGLGGYAVGVAWLAKEKRAEVMEAMGQAGADPAWGRPDPQAPSAPAVFDGGDARQPRTALVPGFVSGLLDWQAKRGKLTRAQVLAPAIALARDGFVVGPLNHRLFSASVDKLKADPEAAALFMPGGEVLKVGDRLVQPKLATLLEAIARDGASAFYTGEFARRVAEKTRSVGGLLDARDFAAYAPAMRRPVCSAFGRFTVLGAPSPVAGASMAELLQLAERSGLTRMGDPTRDTASAVRLADAVRVSVADRALLRGHPEWAPGPVRGLSSAAFAGTRVALVGQPVRDTLARGDAWAQENVAVEARCAALDPYPATARPASSAPGDADAASDAFDHEANGSQTSHLVVIDAERNAVSLTSSVGVLFGSGVYAEGIWLNSSGNLFGRGERAPGRKPGSALTPTLMLEGDRVRFGLGAGGAAYIPTAVGQVALRIAGWGQEPYAALQAPRLQPSAIGRALEIEQGFALPVYGALRSHGYVATNRVANLQFAGVHLFWVRPDGVIVGAADPRRDGVAVGY